MEFGYVRVSSKDQNIARQVEAIEALGIDRKKIFVDMKSGKILTVLRIKSCWARLSRET